jgi:hypothetical protein
MKNKIVKYSSITAIVFAVFIALHYFGGRVVDFMVKMHS